MRFPAFALALVVLLAACTGTPRVRTEVDVPALAAGAVGVDPPYADGWNQLQAGDTRQAMELFRRSRADEDRLYVAFGFVYLVRGRLELAKKNFSDALTLNPGSAPARLGMAEYYRNRGNIREAFRIYSRLRSEFPDNPWIRLRHEQIRSRETGHWLREADRLQRSGQENDAYRRALETALEFSPDMVAVKERLAEYYRKRKDDTGRAADVYEDILVNAPANLEAMEKLGRLYEEQGRYDRALVIYRRLMEKNPGNLEISNRINELKVRFNEKNFPVRFKNIYFKADLSREELAALLGHYFKPYLELDSPPEIITDIQHSFARDAIVRVCSLGIMSLRPDHTFGVGNLADLKVNRAQFAVVMDNLIRFLERRGMHINLSVGESTPEAVDVLPVHKQYQVIRFAVNARLMNLDESGRFRPAESVSPVDALQAILEIQRRMRKES